MFFFFLLVSSVPAILCFQIYSRVLLCSYLEAYIKHLTDKTFSFILIATYFHSPIKAPLLYSFHFIPLMSQFISFYICLHSQIIIPIVIFNTLQLNHWGFPFGSVVKNLPDNAGDTSSIPGSSTSPAGGNGNPLRYSCLGNPMDRGAWHATVHKVAKCWT